MTGTHPVANNLPDPLNGLTSKERAFVMELLHDDSPYQAALRAGFCLNDLESTDPTVDELMNDPRILHAVRSARAQREARVQMTTDTVLHELSLLSHSSLEHYVVDDDGQVRLADGAPEGALRAVQSIKRRITTRVDKDGGETKTVDVEVKLWDKPNPLKLMGRHLGLFPDKVEVTGKDGGPIELANLTTEELEQRALELAKQAKTLTSTTPKA